MVAALAAAALVAGCAAPAAERYAVPVTADATDVWFMQHLVPHLRQTVSVLTLCEDRISRPELARLATQASLQGQAHLARLQAWLDQRGLAPHGHSHQAVDRQPRSDLEGLARVPDARFDAALAEVLVARQRAGDRLAAIELGGGSLPEVRQLARQLQAEHRPQIRQLTAWRDAWSRTTPHPGPA